MLKQCSQEQKIIQPELIVRILNSTKVVIFSIRKREQKDYLNSKIRQQATHVINFKLADLNPLSLSNIKGYSTRKYDPYSNLKHL
jgi:hypothetical protein